MRLATYRNASGEVRIGALVRSDAALVDLRAGAERCGLPGDPYRTMLSLIDGGDAALDGARTIVDAVLSKGIDAALCARAAVTLLAPVPEPRQMRDFLLFEQHLKNARANRFKKLAAQAADPAAAYAEFERRGVIAPPKVWYQQPIYYKCNRFSVVGPDAEVRWPRYSSLLDYELEFGVFLGKGGANIPAAKAKPHIFGYTIFNDFSARDAQSLEMEGQLGPAKGKDFDTGNAMGPCLVTADEIPDPYSLAMKARVNGAEWSNGRSSGMHFTFEQVIEFVSRDETLHAGEFLGSGTVGTGCGLELDRWLAPGDVVELEVERIGILRNTIVRPPPS